MLEDSLGFHGVTASLQEPEKAMNGTEAGRLQERGHCPPTHHTHYITPSSSANLQR